MSGGNWAWRPNFQTRVALRRGGKRYSEWRKKLVERVVAARREALARRAGS